MAKRIFITRRIPDLAVTMLKEKGFEVDVYPKDAVIGQRKLVSYLKKAPYDGVISLLTDDVNAAVFDAAPSVKIVANYATGFNNIDLAEAKKRGITVTNTPGVSSLSVAEHALALMLALTTRLVEGDRYMRKGKYRGWEPMLLIGTDFKGKTIGLIGVGAIGAEVARMAYHGFGARIVYYDVMPNSRVEEECKAERVATVEAVLAAADIVSLHVPLLDSTHHLINETRLKLMKPTAFLVNTSRGPVIDEVALVAALQGKAIAGAALDVFEFEPKLSPGLNKLSNVILTPHIASARESARNDMARIAAQGIIDFFEGKTPVDAVA